MTMNMKTGIHFSSASQPRRTPAFTLTELMVSMSIFVGILVGTTIALQLFGEKVYILAATKMAATADARKSLNSLRSHVRSAKEVYVGDYTNNNFSLIPSGHLQTGNALELYYLNTNDQVSDTPVIYYQSSEGTHSALYCLSNQVVTKLANYVTNYDVFRAEDYQGQIMSTHVNNRVICITLHFYQWEYPIGIIGTNGLNAYNFYRLQTRVTRRAKE